MNLITNTIEKTVDETMTAKALGSGTLEVLGTPALIALMEETCWRSVDGEFGEGKSTVGTRIEIKHLAPTALGGKIRCESELTEENPKRLIFTVKAYDENGLIGEGVHERAVVDNARFLERLGR